MKRNLLTVILLAVLSSSAAMPQGTPTEGRIVANKYENTALGMTIPLTGEWHIVPQEKKASARSTGCKGPFCRPAAVEENLFPAESRLGAIFLLAYKVELKKYRLKDVADAMTKGSMGGTSWVMLEDLTRVELDGRTAYRLLVHKEAGGHEAKGTAYVAESNGFIFMLIAVSGPDPESTRVIQSALDGLRLGKERTLKSK